jgi:hypothetical protein
MLQALFCWLDNAGSPKIFQVSPTGSGSCFRTHRAAIGSGGPFAEVALASLAHLQTHELDLERLKMVAFKAVQDVIFASSWGVGFPIQMYTITPNEGAHRLVVEEINALRDAVVVWAQKQRLVLGELAEAPAAAVETQADQALPESEEPEAPDPGLEPESEEDATDQESL